MMDPPTGIGSKDIPAMIQKTKAKHGHVIEEAKTIAT